NGPELWDIALAPDPRFETAFEPGLLGGVTAIYCDGTRSGGAWEGELYREEDLARRPVRLKAVPYFAWDNRGANAMTVWINQR
ncbi:MAG: hypothetical protein Q8M76_07030, partial [Spirochaetaceae bacterium]|nr:hypothetical protein [Spirochaetaceae bacterium]